MSVNKVSDTEYEFPHIKSTDIYAKISSDIHSVFAYSHQNMLTILMKTFFENIFKRVQPCFFPKIDMNR